MTISSTIRKAGPFAGNNVTVVFPFTFKVFDDTDMVVVATDASDVESTLTLTTHYTVSINADQDASPGGTVTCVTAPASGTLLTITSDVPDLQPVSLTNGGGFYPAVINGALDRLTIQVQQVAEAAERAVKVQISSSTSPDDLIAALTADAASAAASAASAASSAAAAAAAIPVGSLGYTPVDVAGDTMTGPLEVPSLIVNGSSPISTIGNAATKSVGLSPGDVPVWESIPLNGVLGKSANYPIVVADRGKLIDYTGAPFTLTLPLAASAGDGYVQPVRNSAASGNVTIARNGANIDGDASDIAVAPGESFFLVCDGTAWKTVGRKVADTFESSARTITASGLLTIAHPLGVVPGAISYRYKCVTAEGGWSVGDEVSSFVDSNYALQGFIAYADSTNVYIRFASNVTPLVLHKTTGAWFNPVASNWNLIVRVSV